MMVFPEPGSIPGVPGLYTNHLARYGTISEPIILIPLTPHPHFEPALEEQEAPPEVSQVVEEEETPCL